MPSTSTKYQLGRFRPMMAAVANEDLRGLAAIVIQLYVMLPGEPLLPHTCTLRLATSREASGA